ncbi:SoxR reducing system RseC family protein [Clostridium beijerinckii]|jgi:hypothetical protein|nr:SoxR reducing system RseC family protein [Clostridium beijerinckii]NRT68100.1 amino acid transporter [Clostridium beijerinckii]NRU47677.1 amino acid transporter [Clostridium beijerinckii]NSA13524.1 amino acid transporter [Clostridium beijerinckii]NSA63337.1 amino acid transporter [Clostridium beijerinckii]NYC08177.1 amino acid transporter [Clostridium beijerinckii]
MMRRKLFGFGGFILINIMLYVYIIKVFLPVLNSIGGYESEAVGPTNWQVLQALGIIAPAILIYFVAVYLFYYFKITGLNKFVFPILSFTFYLLFIFLGIAVCGGAFGWIVLLTFIPAIIVLLLSFFLGWKYDKKYKNQQKLNF